MVLVGVTTAVASRRIGEREAIVDARTTTLVIAQGLVEPHVQNGLLTGQPAAVQQVRQVIGDVSNRSLRRVKIWNASGTIVYSDEPRLEGSKYTLGKDELAALQQGRIEADVSDLSRPENRYERGSGKLLEVYLPIRTPSGKRLLFEAYYDYAGVTASGRRIWRSFAPVSLGALIALELVQIPLAWSLARRLRQRQREREGLLRQALEASDIERRRIAADLHDGVVQDLAGVAYELAGAARREEATAPTTAELLDASAAEVRETIKALRSLLVEIYPPNLFEEGLEAALTDLLARTNGRGMRASLASDGLSEPLPPLVAGLLYRAAQEGLRNALSHADAEAVTVRVANDDVQATLDIEDNGVGFDTSALRDNTSNGHFGLIGLRALFADAGGVLTVTSEPGQGTHMHAEVPVQ
ncbi:MAG: two-component sensor histidine kinase [Actinomycetia bacterium]|nr:two-component sensor histidine kinase [Actinomycetes bacterium]